MGLRLRKLGGAFCAAALLSAPTANVAHATPEVWDYLLIARGDQSNVGTAVAVSDARQAERVRKASESAEAPPEPWSRSRVWRHALLNSLPVCFVMTFIALYVVGAGVVFTAHDSMTFCYQKLDCFHGGEEHQWERRDDFMVWRVYQYLQQTQRLGILIRGDPRVLSRAERDASRNEYTDSGTPDSRMPF